jgi:hypothetical protein
MKRLVILSLLLFNVIFTSHAQLELRHLIRPGETPTSIAAKYGVSVQNLINSNREFGKFYTGATIVVPVIKSPAKNELVSSTKSTSHSHTSYQTSSNQNEASNAVMMPFLVGIYHIFKG